MVKRVEIFKGPGCEWLALSPTTEDFHLIIEKLIDSLQGLWGQAKSAVQMKMDVVSVRMQAKEECECGNSPKTGA